MLTRSAVAKKLGRSLATVRRLEGKELFPVRDARGVYRFDEYEVQQVVRALKRGDVEAARGQWLRRWRPHKPPQASRSVAVAGARDELARLRQENLALRRDLEKAQVALAELVESLEDLLEC